MNLEKYIAISGVPGIHRLITTRGNGIIIDDRNEGRTRFIPIRQNPVTPLATIGIYINNDQGTDTAPLGEVFQKMLDAIGATPPVDPNGSNDSLRSYFATILPEHDQDQVRIADIKKCIKWFNFMNEKGIFDDIRKDAAAVEAVADAAEAELAEAEKAVPVEETPAPKASKKKKSEA